MSISETRLTVPEAARAIGKWVAVMPGSNPAIILKVVGESVLVRYAGDRVLAGQRSGYHTVGVNDLVRREDWDTRPMPDWLQLALRSSRPARELHDVIQVVKGTGYSTVALTTDNLLDELTYTSYRHNRRLSPHRTPDEWRRIYGDAVDAMEARYQRELPQLELDEATS